MPVQEVAHQVLVPQLHNADAHVQASPQFLLLEEHRLLHIHLQLLLVHLLWFELETLLVAALETTNLLANNLGAHPGTAAVPAEPPNWCEPLDLEE